MEMRIPFIREFFRKFDFSYLFYVCQEECLCLLTKFRRVLEKTPKIHFLFTREMRDIFFRFNTGRFLRDFLIGLSYTSKS